MTDHDLIARIEAAALRAWPQQEAAREDGWLLRAAGGHTRRANSVQALTFAAHVDLERAIGRVEAWYEERGLPACFQLTDSSAPIRLDQTLARRGYARLSPVSVLVRDVAGLEPLPGVTLDLDTRATPRVMNAVCDPHWPQATRRARADLFGRIRKPHVFAIVLEGGHPIAGGLGVLDGDLLGVLAVRTAPAARDRGCGRAVIGRLALWGRGMGARLLYQQVEDGNRPAQAMARRLAFARAYGYWYRELGPQSPSEKKVSGISRL